MSDEQLVALIAVLFDCADRINGAIYELSVKDHDNPAPYNYATKDECVGAAMRVLERVQERMALPSSPSA